MTLMLLPELEAPVSRYSAAMSKAKYLRDSSEGSIKGKAERDLLMGFGKPTIRKNNGKPNGGYGRRGGSCLIGAIMGPDEGSSRGSVIPGACGGIGWRVPAVDTRDGGLSF
jgi:hypothetical protein